MQITDKKVIITGGSTGIGLQLAKQMAQAGAKVCIIARHEERLTAAAAEINSLSSTPCLTIPADVSKASEAESAIQKFKAEIGEPDILVNCAGVAHPGYVQELPLDIYHWMMDVNYMGTVNMTKAVLPGMIQRNTGYIVNTGSLASVIGLFGYTAYGASKFAVKGFSDALRSEMKPLGIKVSLVLPPDTDTPQLAYENQYKPPELKMLFPELGIVKPEIVAREIIRGIQKERYMIIPDFGSKILYKLIFLFGDGVYPIVDFLVARAKKKMETNKP